MSIIQEDILIWIVDMVMGETKVMEMQFLVHLMQLRALIPIRHLVNTIPQCSIRILCSEQKLKQTVMNINNARCWPQYPLIYLSICIWSCLGESHAISKPSLWRGQRGFYTAQISRLWADSCSQPLQPNCIVTVPQQSVVMVVWHWFAEGWRSRNRELVNNW